MAIDLAQIARDIRKVARAVDRLWDCNAAPAGIRADADTIRRTVDERALARVVAFLLDNGEPNAAHEAAQRLNAVLQPLTTKQRATLEDRLEESA